MWNKFLDSEFGGWLLVVLFIFMIIVGSVMLGIWFINVTDMCNHIGEWWTMKWWVMLKLWC